MSAEKLLSDKDQLELTIALHREGLFGIKENENDYIKLKSGRMSPHYFDIRPGLSNPRLRNAIGFSMFQLARLQAQKERGQFIRSVYDHIAGTPEAMTSYAANIADKARMSLLQPRVGTTKITGNKTPILGKYQSGDRVAEFDDVVTDGQSKIDTIKSMASVGLKVVDYFVVVDREEGGANEVYEATGIAITSALAVSGIARMLRAENEISRVQFENVAQYLDEYGDPGARLAMGTAA